MVDVSEKPVSKRTATASTRVTLSAEAAAQVREGSGKKGDVLTVARLAAISATKWTQHLIPLCHAIPIESVTVEFEWLSPPTDDSSRASEAASEQLLCRVTCSTSAKTGIEMEAMTGASLAGLTVYDMMKSVDRRMVIGPTLLEKKRGGASGNFERSD